MILSSHGLIASGLKGGFDADYQAVLNYATSQGYTLPSAGQQVKQNQLMLDLKSGGIWSKLDTFTMFANDGGSNFGLIDWKRLTTYTNNNCTFTTNQGFQGNGSNAWINTNFNPATQGINYKLNDAGRYFWVDLRSGLYMEGGQTSAFVNNTLNSNNQNQRINQGSNSLNSSVNFAVDGYKAINRTSSTNVELFASTTQYSRTATSTAILSENQAIIGGQGGVFSSTRFKFYAMGASLVSENTNFYNAINSYLTSL